jgi:hypothetical protein
VGLPADDSPAPGVRAGEGQQGKNNQSSRSHGLGGDLTTAGGGESIAIHSTVGPLDLDRSGGTEAARQMTLLLGSSLAAAEPPPLASHWRS